MDKMEAFKIGLTTWSNWIDSNIDPSKTSVIFQGIAAAHAGLVHLNLNIFSKIYDERKYFLTQKL